MYQRLRDLREDRDLPQRVLAELLHVSQATYSRYESGGLDIPSGFITPAWIISLGWRRIRRRIGGIHRGGDGDYLITREYDELPADAGVCGGPFRYSGGGFKQRASINTKGKRERQDCKSDPPML